MFRIVLVAVTALALSACGPSVKVDPADPWASLHPWNHAAANVEKLPSGVEYVVVRKGDGKGPFPGPTDQVEVNYEGRLAPTGLIFDSSYQRNESATFALSGCSRATCSCSGFPQPKVMASAAPAWTFRRTRT